MSGIPKLHHMLDRFNQGCSFFQKAVDSWKSGDMHGYETALRKAATEAIGALEWGLKIYLRHVCRDRIIPDDKPMLKQPNFDDLMILMQKYAEPSLKPEDISLLYDYRDLFRNAAEHDASVPPSQELCDAIQKVRCIILTYLPVQEDGLRAPSLALTPEGVIRDLKVEYFKTLRSRYEYMDLGGISPRVGSKVVKIRMKDLFIPLRAKEEEALFESFLEESDPIEPSELSDGLSLLDDETVTKEDSPMPEPDGLDAEEVIRTRYRRMQARSMRIDSMLEKPKVVVLGHPGSGKTTVAKYIAYSIATEKADLIGKHLEHHIPVIIKAAEYAASLKTDSTLSFYDYVIQGHTSKFGKLFEWALQSGLSLMIIDGLDEVPDAQLRVMTSRRIEVFVSEFQRNRFLVTSRIVGYRQNQLAGDFAHVMLSELDEDQVLQFLEQWYRAIESETELPIDEDEIKRRASSLWEAIESNPGISKLAGNPLLLTIIALANWRGTKLPNRRVELYQIATETLVENWPLKQRGVSLDSEEILAILEPIAHQIFSSGKNNLITERDLRPLFESQVCEVRGISPNEAKTLSREILQTIEVDTGFFLAKGFDQHSQTVYGFLHLTFAEYLTARFMAEQWSSDQLDLQRYAHDDRWHEVLLLMAGHIGTWAIAQATRLVNDILDLNSPYEEYLHRNLLLAAEILGDNVRVKRALQDEIVSRLLCLALRTPHIALWSSVVSRLSDIARVLQLGRPALQLQPQESDSLEMQVRKAVLLARTGKDVTDGILRTLLQGLSETEKTRRLIGPFLYSENILSQEDDATHLLAIQAATSGHLYRISEQTASRIAKLMLPIHGANSLIERQLPATKATCRLWLLNPTEVLALGLPKITSLLTADNWPIQFLIAATLELQDSYISICNSLFEFIASRDSTDTCIAALDSIQALLSAASIYRRARPEDDNALKWADSVRPLVTSDDDPVIRSKALGVLSMFTGDMESWFELLCHTLNDSEEIVRSTAATIASRYGARIPDPMLVKLHSLLRDPSLDVRQASAHTLIKTGRFVEEDVILLLEAGFEQSTEPIEARDMDTWLTSLLLLANKSRSPEILDVIGARIREILEARITQADEQSVFYWYPFFGERRIRPQKELTEAVSLLFDNPDPIIRHRAVSVWSHIRPETVPFSQWRQLLEDDDLNVKVAAIRALRSTDLQQPGIRNILFYYLIDVDLRVANSAASALSTIREPELRQDVIAQVAALVTQKPESENAYKVLWELVSPNAGWFDNIPF